MVVIPYTYKYLKVKQETIEIKVLILKHNSNFERVIEQTTQSVA